MTLTCPSSSCPFCVGDACNACTRDPRAGRCRHGPAERHQAIPALERAETLESRVPTKPLPEPFLAGRIEVDFADGEQAAAFLELVAKVIRSRSKVSLIIE